MNFSTSSYSDNLDGENLACAPRNVAEGLEFLCTAGIPILGVGNLLNGVWSCLLAGLKWRNNNAFTTTKQARNTPTVATAAPGGTKSTGTDHSKHEQQASKHHVELLLVAVGVAGALTGVTILLTGYGTMYPTTHIRSQVGDFVAAFQFATAWYSNLLQIRGAKHFKSLVQGRGSDFRNTRLQSISNALNVMQSWLAPVIALGFWGLMRAGVYTRGWYFFLLFLCFALCGIRNFIYIVIQRLGTLRRVFSMVNARSGTREDVQRRRRVLGSKFATICVDIFMVFLVCVLMPGTFLFVGSTFNSRQMAIHVFAIYVVTVTTTGLANLRLHSVFRARIRRHKKGKNLNTNRHVDKQGASVVPSGAISSMQGSSCVYGSDV